MWYLLLLAFVFVLYAPPLDAASHVVTWAESTGWVISLGFFSISWQSRVVPVILMVASYVILAALASWLLRSLWPGEKPALLRALCAPDLAGGFDLLLLVAGCIVFVCGVLLAIPIGLGGVHARPDIAALGLLFMAGVVGHAVEMNLWQFDVQETRRRLSLRGE